MPCFHNIQYLSQTEMGSIICSNARNNGIKRLSEIQFSYLILLHFQKAFTPCILKQRICTQTVSILEMKKKKIVVVVVFIEIM